MLRVVLILIVVLFIITVGVNFSDSNKGEILSDIARDVVNEIILADDVDATGGAITLRSVEYVESSDNKGVGIKILEDLSFEYSKIEDDSELCIAGVLNERGVKEVVENIEEANLLTAVFEQEDGKSLDCNSSTSLFIKTSNDENYLSVPCVTEQTEQDIALVEKLNAFKTVLLNNIDDVEEIAECTG